MRPDRRGLALLLFGVLVLAALVGAGCWERGAEDDEVGVLAVRERIAINTGSDSWIHSGADVRLYSDRSRATETGRLDGAGGWQIAAPTAVATATPAFLVKQAGVGQIASFQDGTTEIVGIRDGGGVVVAAPTAVATAQPALAVSNTGVSALVDISGSSLEYQFDTSALDLQSNYLEADIGTEHLMLPSVISTAITYTAAAGGTGAVATIGDGEIWIVHDVFVNVTTNFDCTGDDTTLIVGDGADTDGFVVLADAELQAADTEATGFAAGWQGLIAATQGAYIDEAAGANSFIYAPSVAAETIDWLVDEGSGETITAGAATIYVVYTRIQ